MTLAGDGTFSLSLASLATVEPWKERGPNLITLKVLKSNPHLDTSRFLCPSYLEIIFFVDRQAVREHIACNNHVCLVSIHGEPIHPQELRQQCVAMALHNELGAEREKTKRLMLQHM